MVKAPPPSLRRPRLAVALLFSTLLLLALCAIWVSIPSVNWFYRKEILLLLGLQAVISLIVYFNRSPLVLALVQGFRGLLILVCILSTEPVRPVVALALLLPYVASSVLYFSGVYAVVLTGSASLIPLVSVFFGFSAGLDQPSVWARVSLDTTLILLTAASFALLNHYREKLVAYSSRNELLFQSVSNLTESNVSFQTYADAVAVNAEIRERNRITRELHDSIGYSLTNIHMLSQAAVILQETGSNNLNGVLNDIREQSNLALSESRKILHTIREVRTDGPKGTAALRNLTATFSKAMGIRVELELGNFPQTLGPEVDDAVYRFVQEGLTNTFKHGKATHVRITCHRSDREVLMTIHDNGRGKPETLEGIGIRGMRERFAPFHAQVEAKPLANGFCLYLTIPYPVKNYGVT